MTKKYFATLIFLLLVACNADYGNRLNIDGNAGEIDFSAIIEGEWDRVCLFEPYSNNEVAKKLLGFHWDLEGNSAIYMDEGLTLFVFAKGNEVEVFHEVPRWADFSHLGGKCFLHGNSVFNIKSGDAKHVPKNV
jgi:hypothetical protein